jgi:type IV pilus assembly protein PilC
MTSEGVIQATSLMEASDRLRSAGGLLLRIGPAGVNPLAGFARLRAGGLKFGPGLKDVQNFTNQLAVMIKAGISIRSAIDGVAEQIEHVKFKEIVAQIKNDVEAGQPFSAALARHPKVFSPLYVNMVRASELSGNFGMMLERISNYLAQQMETRSMVRGAMVYPGIIATMAVSTTIFLLTFVLPKFTTLFKGKEALLPKPTVFLLALSDLMRNYWWALLIGLGALIWSFMYFVNTQRGREAFDGFKLKMPLFKRMFRALYITRGLHTMGELVNAGVPVLETLAITAEVSGNILYRRLWQSVHLAVKQGSKIATPLARQQMLPKHVVQMISAGEESGKLAEVMRDIAEYYAKELKNTIKSVTAMIEPLMIVIMGVIVGFIAMSIILPIFKMSSLAKH